MRHPYAATRHTLALSDGRVLDYFSLPSLEATGIGPVSTLPVSIRIVLESVLRHCDGLKVTPEHVRALANWQPRAERHGEIPFTVARVILQDFTGVPLLADLAAMRSVASDMKLDPKRIEPLVPVDLVVDHSVMVDEFASPQALRHNMEHEFARNRERYQFMKWGMQAFDTFQVVPPGIGIVHQLNLEYLFHGLREQDGVVFPDTLVGTDSHTTMINGVGVVGWGVGGIEAEAAMLGQPVYLLTPDVVGVELDGQLAEGISATDLVLTLTQMLRSEKVVGCFVEFFGAGSASLSVADRATIANMAPEYGATMGFFPVDDNTLAYMRGTGRSEADILAFAGYFKAQGLFGMPKPGDIAYSRTLRLDLASITPSLAGPKRPQDRIGLEAMKDNFTRLFSMPAAENGFNKAPADLAKRYPLSHQGSGQSADSSQRLQDKSLARDVVEMVDNRPTPDHTPYANGSGDLGHGDILIAAITSCTNTSNPGVMLAAGLLAQKAVAKGLQVNPRIKTSLAPGSRVVTAYLEAAGLLAPLAKLGFALAAYGCTTCIGNAGDLAPELNNTITRHDLVCAAVLSGNRNFEARIHPNLRANYLASPPLVVAFAIAGRIDIDLTRDPLGTGKDGQPVHLRDIWPGSSEIAALMATAFDPATFRRLYADFTRDHDLWNEISAPQGETYPWPSSSYIARPPFFDGFSMQEKPVTDIRGARALLLLGDSVTTDHISPAGSFGENTPAGQYLSSLGLKRADFNSYGSRRGNHEVMLRGTFANVRIKNMMLPAKDDGSRIEGGYTLLDGVQTSVYQAAMVWQQRGIATLVFAGEEYGTGSSRDWAAKGSQLLGIRAVIARSFERIHRSNLVGMGVLPLQFMGSDSWQSLGIQGNEIFTIEGIAQGLAPQQLLSLSMTRPDGSSVQIPLRCRIDTPIEVDYYRAGGILPFVLRGLLSN
ncbi:aconitate hydratase AcnA [Craterilacuibacter sp. RT1T]|uniref:aconitate hydratase AcnA n=1 Tax=Craterilacuibacter sp. RT1T TaxID=2942211 RepID=UPI0020C09D0D|nr:aconitate hydratase AcnA [Craterilacuibacter sp. RT1T]MCL6262887.1 aconitate hydratase AcnA [Craterilacuibacter sp. RT1T]